MSKLSIGIPTFNRLSQLESQLERIFDQNIDFIHQIIICNNGSDDLNSIIDKFDRNKIKLINNKFNVGLAVNLLNPFLHCDTKWLWLLSDDDEILGDSIKKIHNEIAETSSDVGLIKFSTTNKERKEKDFTVNNLESFIDYYGGKKIRRGEMVLISTNVYNLESIKDFLKYGFDYSYTYVGHLIPIFMGLNKSEIKVRFSSLSLVNYVAPEKWGWSFTDISKGLSTLSHLPIELTQKYWKLFLNVTMLVTLRSVIVNYLISEKNFRTINDKDLKIIYNNIYRYYVPIKYKIVYRIILFPCTKKIFRFIYNKILSFKSCCRSSSKV